MNTSAKTISLIAATLLAFAGSAKAQLQTFETVSQWEGSANSFTNASATKGEIFTNVNAVKSMTYNFFSTGSSVATNFTATFGQWNGTGFVAGTTVSFGSITVPAFSTTSGQWSQLYNDYTVDNGITTYTHEQAFDLTTLNSGLVHMTYGYLTNSSKSYALMLTKTTPGSTGVSLGFTNSDTFAYGTASTFPSFDWAFAQIVIVPGNVPVPESSTVASVGAALLVAGLVGYRIRQRRNAGADVSTLTAA